MTEQETIGQGIKALWRKYAESGDPEVLKSIRLLTEVHEDYEFPKALATNEWRDLAHLIALQAIA
jgi:hypothetical protein